MHLIYSNFSRAYWSKYCRYKNASLIDMNVNSEPDMMRWEVSLSPHEVGAAVLKSGSGDSFYLKQSLAMYRHGLQMAYKSPNQKFFTD